MADDTKQDTAVKEAEPGKRLASPDSLKPSKPKPRLIPDDEDEKRADLARMKRRKFIGLMITGFLLANLAAFMKFFFPRTLFEPKTKFPIGPPADYGFGVDTSWQASQRIWVVRDAVGLFVILAKCTHLGCTPDWKETENKFKCPCHGSGFTKEGINFEGPAPKPLQRCHVALNAQGQIVVDKLKLYDFPQFDDSGALLKV